MPTTASVCVFYLGHDFGAAKAPTQTIHYSTPEYSGGDDFSGRALCSTAYVARSKKQV